MRGRLNRLDVFRLTRPNLALLLYLMIATITWATTVLSTYELYSVIRIALIVILAGLVLSASPATWLRNKTAIRGIFLLGAFVGYGALMAYINDGVAWLSIGIGRDVVMLAVYIIILGATARLMFADKTIGIYIVFATLLIGVTILSGGVSLNPPGFVFHSLPDDSINTVRGYSQGVSRLYGLCGILCAYLAYRKDGAGGLCLFFLCIVFLGISLLGGARGDFLAAVVVTCVLLALKFKVLWIAAIPIIATAAVFAYDADIDLSGMVFFRRLLDSTNPLGSRPELFGQAINLLLSDPACFFFGRGFGYFQDFYGHVPGRHPHNIILSSAVVFGVPLTLIWVAATAAGAYRLWMDARIRAESFLIFTSYFFLVSLKSGSLLSSWFVLGASVYLIAFPRTRKSRVKEAARSLSRRRLMRSRT